MELIESCSSEEENKSNFGEINKRNRVSIIWTYFEQLDQLNVRCKICDKIQIYQGNPAGNLLRHLKVIHAIDATLKDQVNHPNISKSVETMQRINQRQHQENSNPSNNHAKNKEDDNDPYTSYSNFETYLNSNEETTTASKTNTVEEQRLLAEIEYFREKAAYYRMQKNLTALQARKIKYELDQLCTL